MHWTIWRLAGSRGPSFIRRFASLAEQNLSNWLVVNTSTNRQQQGDGQYPPMPLTLKEIHLANVPKDVHGNSIRNSYPGMTERIHASRDDAVLKALASTYQFVPREEVARTLESATAVEKALVWSARVADWGPSSCPSC